MLQEVMFCRLLFLFISCTSSKCNTTVLILYASITKQCLILLLNTVYSSLCLCSSVTRFVLVSEIFSFLRNSYGGVMFNLVFSRFMLKKLDQPWLFFCKWVLRFIFISSQVYMVYRKCFLHFKIPNVGACLTFFSPTFPYVFIHRRCELMF